MAQSFPLFPNFPKEIRDQIWDCAVRPVDGTRHVHSFLLVDHYYSRRGLAGGTNKNKNKQIDGDFLRIGEREDMWRMAVPRGENDSAYVTDSGMWMACAESREAMERYFTKNEWWSDIPFENPSHRHGKSGAFFPQPNIAHTAAYTGPDGQTRHVTFMSDRDLIYFEGSQVEQVESWLHYAGDYIPLFDRRGGKQPEASFVGMDVAIDLDPQWFSYVTSDLIEFLMAIYSESERTVWLVDHRLKRTRLSTAIGESNGPRETFYSDKRVFTEVRSEDLDQSNLGTLRWVSEGPHSDKSGMFFIKFLTQEDGGLVWPDAVEDVSEVTNLRVLACEYLD